MSATLFQPDPSAKAPCTRTTFLICCFTTVLLFKDPHGSFYFRFQSCASSRQIALASRAGCTFLLQLNIYWLLVGVCGGGSLFDELGCFLRMRHISDMAGIHFDRLGIGALRHHAFLYRIDRPV